MANKMLIDATHPEETRVVVLRGNRVEEFDFESAHRKQLRGNIYLAKVTRVEPSLQAAFIDYGGNRHGFLAFSEIHPDYYQIPIADRQALIDEEGRAQRAAEDEADRRSQRHHRSDSKLSTARRDGDIVRSELAEPSAVDGTVAEERIEAAIEDDDAGYELAPSAEEQVTGGEEPAADSRPPFEAEHAEPAAQAPTSSMESVESGEGGPESAEPSGSVDEAPSYASAADTDDSSGGELAAIPADESLTEANEAENDAPEMADSVAPAENGEDDEAADEVVESLGGADALEEVPDRAPRYRRQYKIQEVIKRRQIMLVQVVKEERGSKGAALTTYLSLAGRYSVLMPNTARGGGISRKITSAEDRSRLKEIAQELEVPEGMGVILRTAGASRTKTEIKRDFEYLLRLWETVRDLTLKSTAPKLVYEEGSLVKRSIRDLYSKDIDEVIVAGADAYHEAKDFMRMLMPSHAKNVKLYSDAQPLFSGYAVESQLDGMFTPVVQLRSGGYVVLNQAEALVAIDVNSGRATREHHIEDTALKTNMEAADEIARQLRLRDLAGLIVIDFIDMDEKRNNRAVERRLKECLKQDRARIQVGRISHFGLLEMSRQRIRTSVLESSTEKCPYCGGTGHVRSVSSLALQVLRALEEQLMKGATHNLTVRTRRDVALYILNQKRAHLRVLEERFAINITVIADDMLTAPLAFAIDRGEQVHSLEAAKALVEQSQTIAAPLEEEDELEEAERLESEDNAAPLTEMTVEQSEGGPRRRRRRRRRGRNGGEAHALPPRQEESGEGVHEAPGQAIGTMLAENAGEAPDEAAGNERGESARDGERRRRRRGRRGGRRNRIDRERDAAPAADDRGDNEVSRAPSTAEELTAPPEPEPDPRQAVADFEAAPLVRPPAASAPDVDAPTAAAASGRAPGPPRRRSTVREPAPLPGSSDQPEPATRRTPPASAQPVITEEGDSESANRPRRSGWWSRRMAGG